MFWMSTKNSSSNIRNCDDSNDGILKKTYFFLEKLWSCLRTGALALDYPQVIAWNAVLEFELEGYTEVTRGT